MRDLVTFLAADPWPAVPRGSRLLVPIGSTEQHGPHLPFTTDAVIAAEVASRLAAPGSVVAPALAYGSSGEHQSFPGTLSIGTEALVVVLVELVRSASTWAHSVTLVNGHGGNVGALSTAAARLRDEGHRVAWVPCAVAGADAHAGRTETSIMLALQPDVVDLASAGPGSTEDIRGLMPTLASEGVAAVSPNGVLGDPRGATAAEGRELLDLMVASARRRVEHGHADARGCLVDPERTRT